VVVFIRLSPAGVLRCGSVRPVSSPSIEFAAVVERSTTR